MILNNIYIGYVFVLTHVFNGLKSNINPENIKSMQWTIPK